MTSEAQAQPRWTFSIFMIVLATSIPFVVTGVDPLLLSLNLPVVTQVVASSTPAVPCVDTARRCHRCSRDGTAWSVPLELQRKVSLTPVDRNGCVPGSG